jgi:hypothetical protein
MYLLTEYSETLSVNDLVAASAACLDCMIMLAKVKEIKVTKYDNFI